MSNLGRYLGVPILHGRVTKHTFKFILDHLDNKLAGWKANNLSLAGRVTLASSVLSSIPSYVMQTAFLPVSLCDQIDKKIRSFIWGSTDASRKIHNVNWQTVCKPKSLGGLGLRSARDLNRAFLMKIVWGLISRPNDLWASVMATKYFNKESRGFSLKRRKGNSNVWRGVLSVWEEAHNGLQWSIRNGRNTKFWTDVWLDSGDSLIDFGNNIQGVDPQCYVADFCLTNGSWDFPKLESCLPHDLVLQVAGMTPPCPNAGDDILVWGLEDNGRFSVKSAYALIKDLRLDDSNGGWQKIWRWQGPNKIKHFMWIVAQGSLMTNAKRERRHIATSNRCDICNGGLEDAGHLFRSCSFARNTWISILPDVISPAQLGSDFSSWWLDNISNQKLKNRDWEVTIHHIYREANNAADCLANFGHTLFFGSHVFPTHIDPLLYLLRYDIVGACSPRSINNTS
ncbi:Putative ribonuclease H protein At1g65750 [Linum perenne]